MKATYGKLSIVSFIALVVFVTASVTLARGRYLWDRDTPEAVLFTTFLIFIAGFVFPVTGLTLGYLSALKQELPRCYRYIGFFLNLTWFVIILRLVISILI